MKIICLRTSKYYIFTREQLESLDASAYMQVLSFIYFQRATTSLYYVAIEINKS